jgi:hypothetical protein
MAIAFNSLLQAEGFRVQDVRLLRHKNDIGRTPYACWFNDRDAFEHWQSYQSDTHRTAFARPIWASFVDTPSKETLFVGLYSAAYAGEAEAHVPDYLRGGELVSGKGYDHYRMSLLSPLSDLAGRLFVQWPPGRRWDRKPENFDLPVLALLRAGDEPSYPGHSAFLSSLSEIETLPASWKQILTAAKGTYLLTCAKTREQYVGAAFASGGFYGRWLQHAGRQGDAVAFRSREPTDYRVSILEVAGSLATDENIAEMEQRWKVKLQSREMGLNRN